MPQTWSDISAVCAVHKNFQHFFWISSVQYSIFIMIDIVCLSMQLWDELTGHGKLLQDGVRAVEEGVKVVGEKVKVVEEEVRAGMRSFMEGVECFLAFTPSPVRVRSA